MSPVTSLHVMRPRLIASGVPGFTMLSRLCAKRARCGAEIGLVIRDAEQHAHVRGNEPVIEPQAAGERPADVVPAHRAEIDLEGTRLQVVVGELREKTLGGQASRRT